MDKKEIKDYLKRVDELGTKLTGEDKEAYTWLIYGYNQCAKLLNEAEQQCKKQKEAIDKVKKHCEIEINASNHYLQNHSSQQELCHKVAHQRILKILNEVSE